MQSLRVILALVLLANGAGAQTPYSVTTPAGGPPSWDGQALPQPVPHQPTFSHEPAAAGGYVTPVQYPATSSPAPVMIYDSPPATGYVYTDPAAVPGSPYPGPVPYEPIYPNVLDFDLRASLIPPDARDGFFQKARFTGTWLPQLANDSLGWTDLRSEVMVALPFFTRENPILITPSYELHFLDRPEGFDLPPRLHDLAIDFHIFRVYENRWIFDFAVTPGLFADDYSFDRSDAFRVNGRALAVYVPSPETKWVVGAAYINGAWSKIVPVAGLVYEPTDDVKYELVFPAPKVSWRLPGSPIPGRDEFWFYVAGEFANSIWAFQQDDFTPDVFAYRDFRFLLGLERKVIGGLSHRVEVGYIFNRDMKIASHGHRDIGLNDTILLRAGVVY